MTTDAADDDGVMLQRSVVCPTFIEHTETARSYFGPAGPRPRVPGNF